MCHGCEGTPVHPRSEGILSPSTLRGSLVPHRSEGTVDPSWLCGDPEPP